MKNLVTALILALILSGCSKNDDEPDKGLNAEIEAVNKILNGTFISEEDISYMENSQEIEVVTFNPYSSPEVEQWTNNFGTENVTMYGKCTVTTYYYFNGNTNDKQGEITKEWKYNISIAYSGAQPKLYYYPIYDYGQTQMHNLKIISSTEIEIDNKIFYKK